MRTRTLALTAAISAISAAAMADVVSVNVVGFGQPVAEVGIQPHCNPLKATNDTISAIMPAPSDSQVVTAQKWNKTTQSFEGAITYIPGVGWDNPDAVIDAGEGFFVSLDSAATVTFVGEVRQSGSGTLDTPLGVGFNFVGSQVPQGGTTEATGGITTALGFQPSAAAVDTAQQFDAVTQSYKGAATHIPGVGWDAEPVLAIGEALVISREVAGRWSRSFNVQ